MAEEKQEDMSMDEILSSIKNILSENGEPAEDTPVIKTEAPEDISAAVSDHPQNSDNFDLEENDISVNDLPFSEEDEDILDLTSDMRADIPSPEVNLDAEPTLPADTEIDIDSELADLPEVEAGDAVSDVIEPAISVEDTQDVHDVELESLLPEVSVISDDTDSDPIYTPEDEASSQPLYKGDDALLSDMPEISTQSDSFNVEEMPLKADATPLVERSAESTETNSDAVDVSASIINNFAKIFADSKVDSMPDEAAKVSASVKLGNDATLSDMVKATIRDMLSAQVINTLAQDTDIKALMSAEVSAQVKQWLDKHLPTMVETIVKKEIERVMVKAGRN